MSAPSINRSLTTIRTELEFLLDSEVISQELYDTLLKSLPSKYQKQSQPWGLEKLQAANVKNEENDGTENLSEGISNINLKPQAPPTPPAKLNEQKPVGFCKATYDYQAQQAEDLNLSRGELIAVVEHLSEDWWKGTKDGTNGIETGVFPSNYVTVVSEQEYYENFDRKKKEKSSYRPQEHVPAPPQYEYPPVIHQQSYSGYAQYPPPSTNYYPPQEAQQVQQQQPQAQGTQEHPHLKKFGSKLGNAAIFGAGATIGSDLINSIF